MMLVQENVPLGARTTFRIGGNARYFAEVKSIDELKEAIQYAKDKSVPHLIFGGGSNMLAPDETYEGLVIQIVYDEVVASDNFFTIGAGANLWELIRETGASGFSGWEKLAGIPGTVGGAVRGNAGAFGTEIKDIIEWVEAFDSKTNELRRFENSECEFGYRASTFKNNPHLVVWRTRIRLTAGNDAKALAEIELTVSERNRRHLQNVRAAGSYFMNPVAPKEIQEMFEKEKGAQSREGRVPAGWLIEKAGMKGARVGGAIASEQHPNYIVNEGTATAHDVKELAEQIKKAVREQFGVELHEEAAVIQAILI